MKTIWLPSFLIATLVLAGVSAAGVAHAQADQAQPQATSSLGDEGSTDTTQTDFVQKLISNDNQMLNLLHQSLLRIYQPELRSNVLGFIDTYKKEMAQLQKWQTQHGLSQAVPVQGLGEGETQVEAKATETGMRYDTALIDWLIPHEENTVHEAQDFLAQGKATDLADTLKHIIKSRQKQIAALKYTDSLFYFNNHPKPMDSK